jgi:hypothetical protein
LSTLRITTSPEDTNIYRQGNRAVHREIFCLEGLYLSDNLSLRLYCNLQILMINGKGRFSCDQA